MQLPLLMVDTVLVTLDDGQLQICLMQRTNEKEPFYLHWGLPGGYVRPEEDSSTLATAARVLKSKLSVEAPYLEQLASFSGLDRDPRGWSCSVVYIAIMPESEIDHQNSRWVSIEELDEIELPFDHRAIIDAALERIQSKSKYSTLPFYLMPEHFTLSELRQAYEKALGGEIDQRGFNRKVLASNALEDTGLVQHGSNRPAAVYKANLEGLKHLDLEIKIK